MGQLITTFSNILGGIFRVSRFIKADMSGASAQFVRDTIAQNKVVIFSKSYCPYCTMAKEQFKKLSFPFFTVELENREDCSQIQAVLGEMTGATSVPRVFVDGKFIGGGTDVKKLNETGELQKLLQ
ncbi:Glutaredoxin-C4 [Pseudolycoriella hygida]|uniref:Glutaredoxin-2, mitochondrial n=1 Tax=Pseudolycoriella hygida TaxID=35572 RepID=A0A9Q0N8V0_9DIPT|nr:Glutaredoxin-C4 [Pseudolycoriella hygida]